MNELAHKLYSASPLPGLRRKIQPLINGLYWDETNRTAINHGAKWDYVEVDGLKYAYDPVMVGELRRRDDVIFTGLRRDDTVLDIGSNIGDVALPASTRCRRVYAYEPVFANILEKNVAANRIQNIVVYKVGLGLDAEAVKYEYAGVKETSPSVTFDKMITEPVDFLRCDCEGGEWAIMPEECVSIREMRFEFHLRKNNYQADDKKLTGWLIWWDRNGYKVTMKKVAEWGAAFRVQYDFTASKV